MTGSVSLGGCMTVRDVFSRPIGRFNCLTGELRSRGGGSFRVSPAGMLVRDGQGRIVGQLVGSMFMPAGDAG